MSESLKSIQTDNIEISSKIKALGLCYESPFKNIRIYHSKIPFFNEDPIKTGDVIRIIKNLAGTEDIHEIKRYRMSIEIGSRFKWSEYEKELLKIIFEQTEVQSKPMGGSLPRVVRKMK